MKCNFLQTFKKMQVALFKSYDNKILFNTNVGERIVIAYQFSFLYSLKMTMVPSLGCEKFGAQFRLFSASLYLSETVENENFNYKWHNSCSKVRTQRLLYLKKAHLLKQSIIFA